MKKHIIAALFAAAAFVTFSTASIAQRWGWSDIAGPKAWAVDEQSMVPLADIGAYIGDAGSPPVKVVHVDLEPAAMASPGVLAGVLPALEDALDAIRVIVANDPTLATNLKARGLDAADVVGINHSAGGITLFVSNA